MAGHAAYLASHAALGQCWRARPARLGSDRQDPLAPAATWPPLRRRVRGHRGRRPVGADASAPL